MGHHTYRPDVRMSEGADPLSRACQPTLEAESLAVLHRDGKHRQDV